MPSGPLLFGFIAASLVVLLTPGPGVLYVVARSAAQGYLAGLVSVLGLSAGALVHVVAAAAGLSAILLTSATAFSIVKFIGAGYLIYLGFTAIFGRSSASASPSAPPAPVGRLFRDGVVVSLFNPKIAVFFLAFLPQFVDPAAGPAALQVFALGLVYVGLAILTDGGYALLAGGLRHWVSGRVLLGPAPRLITGGLYIGLGINTALTGREP